MTTRKQFGTLLAVVTLASAPAAAGPRHATHAAVEVAPTPMATPRATPPAVHHFLHSLSVLVGRATTTPAPAPVPITATRPRQLPSGAPACGNVVSKAPRPRECREVTTAANGQGSK